MSTIIDFILGLFNQFISFVLSPIDWLVSSTGNTITNYIEKIWEFFALICQNLLWVMDALSIPPLLVGLIISFYIFRATLFLVIYGVKLFVKWWGTLW